MLVEKAYRYMARLIPLVVCAILLAVGPVGNAVGQTEEAPAEQSGVGPVTGYPLPRFVSMKATEANARRGPGINFPIDWTFIMPGTPLKITDEHGNWRKVEASDGNGGWMYRAMISGRRTVEVIEDLAPMRKRPGEDKWIVAKLKTGVIGDLGKCNEEWCQVTVGKYSGWVKKSSLWGIDDQ